MELRKTNFIVELNWSDKEQELYQEAEQWRTQILPFYIYLFGDSENILFEFENRKHRAGKLQIPAVTKKGEWDGKKRQLWHFELGSKKARRLAMEVVQQMC